MSRADQRIEPHLQLLLRLVYTVNLQVALDRDCHPAGSQVSLITMRGEMP